MDNRKFDFIVVGSGAGGATLARELSKAGRDVLVIERGLFHEKIGEFWDSAKYTDVKGFVKKPLTSKEGVILWRAFMAGGTTVIQCGNAMRFPGNGLPPTGLSFS